MNKTINRISAVHLHLFGASKQTIRLVCKHLEYRRSSQEFPGDPKEVIEKIKHLHKQGVFKDCNFFHVSQMIKWAEETDMNIDDYLELMHMKGRLADLSYQEEMIQEKRLKLERKIKRFKKKHGLLNQ